MADTKQDKNTPPAQAGTTAPPDEGHRPTLGDVMGLAGLKGPDLAPFVDGLREAVAAVRPAFNAANIGADLGGAIKNLAATYKAHTEQIAATLAHFSDFALKLTESTRAGNEYLFWRVKGEIDRANALKVDAKPHVMRWLKRLDDEIIPLMRPGDEDRLRSLKGGGPLELDDFTKNTGDDRSIIARYVKLLSIREKKAKATPADDFHLTPPEAPGKKTPGKKKANNEAPPVFAGRANDIDPNLPALPAGNIFDDARKGLEVTGAVEKSLGLIVSDIDEIQQPDDIITNYFAGCLDKYEYIKPFTDLDLLPVRFATDKGENVYITAQTITKIKDGREFKNILVEDGKTTELFRMIETAFYSLYVQGINEGKSLPHFYSLAAIRGALPGAGDGLSPEMEKFLIEAIEDTSSTIITILTSQLSKLPRFANKENQVEAASVQRPRLLACKYVARKYKNGKIVKGFLLTETPPKLAFIGLVNQMLSIPRNAYAILSFDHGSPRLRPNVTIEDGRAPTQEDLLPRRLREMSRDKNGNVIWLKQWEIVSLLSRLIWREIDDAPKNIRRQKYTPYSLMFDDVANELGLTFRNAKDKTKFIDFIEDCFSTFYYHHYIPEPTTLTNKGGRGGTRIGIQLDFRKDYALPETYRLPKSPYFPLGSPEAEIDDK